MKSIQLLLLMLFGLGGSWAFAQNNCSGTSTEAAEGTFTDGFTYDISFSNNTVTVTAELLDPKVGLIAYAQTYNPNFAEVQMDNTGGQSFSKSFAGQTAGEIFTVAIKFAFAGGLATSTPIIYTIDEGCGSVDPVGELDLPITFEDPDLDYGLDDFEGAQSTLVNDPTDPQNTVVQTLKTNGSPFFAGTTVGSEIGFTEPLPFTTDATTMSVSVWSPTAGIPVRLKVEDLTNPGISVETEATVTQAGVWQTLVFDFDNEAFGTAALNLGANYQKASIFFNFGSNGEGLTYYWDDIDFGDGTINPPAEILEFPVTFEEDIDYGIADFGGNASEIVVDPTDAGNMVMQSVKTGTAELWAGTTIGEVIGFTEAFPFEPGATTMSVRVWSPLAGIPVLLKAENLTDPTVSVETEATVTEAGIWQILTFDFANEANGTAAINFASEYTKVSIFFNFGTTGAASGEQTYYWDDVDFGGGTVNPPAEPLELPVTFEEDIDYGIADFGGNASEIVVDPTDAGNMVMQSVKTGTAELWAGTTVGEVIGFAEAFPFEPGATTMNVRVWSPLAGIPVRLKAENLTDPTVSVETEATVTEAGVWQTLTFDFANQASGTAAINFESVYTKVSIFFNFGTTGASSGEQTYYWDDVDFGNGSVVTTSIFEIIANSPQHTILEDLIILAGLNLLLTAPVLFTVFAPTDAAFALLSPDLVAALTADPSGQLTQVLLYHMAPNALMSGDLSDGQLLSTFLGENVVVTISGGEVMINNAMITTADLQANNGVVHVIDAVLIPTTVGLEYLQAADYNIQVGPNPATDFVNIVFGEDLNSATFLMVYDIAGKLVKQEQIQNRFTQLSTSGLRSGTYVLRIQQGETHYFQKLIIAK